MILKSGATLRVNLKSVKAANVALITAISFTSFVRDVPPLRILQSKERFRFEPGTARRAAQALPLYSLSPLPPPKNTPTWLKICQTNLEPVGRLWVG